MSLFRKIKHEPYIHRGLVFVCPQCDEYPSVNHAVVIKAVRALYIPYFLCSECRLAHINSDIVRTEVKHWWKNSGGPNSGSLKYWQNYALVYMRDELQRYYTDRIGYRFLPKFKRIRPASR